MPQTFGQGKCRFCEREISVCGYGEWQHLRMHYRRTCGKEPPDYYGVRDLTGILLQWKRVREEANS